MTTFADRHRRQQLRDREPNPPAEPMQFVWATVTIGAVCAAVAAMSLGI